jgi:hypothetical protein
VFSEEIKKDYQQTQKANHQPVPVPPLPEYRDLFFFNR